MIKQKTIFLAILNQNNISTDLSKVLNHVIGEDAYRIHLHYSAIKPITYNRNVITQKFLATDYEYLVMVDDDIVPPPNFLRLVDFDKDIITPFLLTRKQGELYPLYLKRKSDGVYDVGDYINETGLQQCDATGTGCIIIKRKVLETIKHPFENKYDTDGIKTLGQDLYFCEKSIKAGFKVWVHLDYIASHFSEIDLKDVYYMTINLERLRVENETLKQYLKENKPLLFNRAMEAIKDKQLIKDKI